MANEVAKIHLPAFGQTLDAWFKRLEFIDVAAVEQEAGLLVDFKYLAQAVGMDNLVYCAYRAQRDRLEKAKGENGPAPIATTTDNLIGGPAGTKGGNQLRKILTAFYVATRRHREYVLEIRLPAGSPALEPFLGFLKEAIAKIVAQDYLGEGQPNIPIYSVAGIGASHESEPGHSSRLVEAARARLKSS